MIHPERVRQLNAGEVRKGRYVLYWMQSAQRAACNHALEYAVRRADELKKPVVTVFGLTDSFPEANLRHYTFLLEGLRETEKALRERGIRLAVLQGAPDAAALRLAGEASLLVTDRGYLRVQKQWRQAVAKAAPCPVVQVETDVIVPVEVASNKEEYAARTLRPKIHRALEEFLVPLETSTPKRDSLKLKLGGSEPAPPVELLTGFQTDSSVGPVMSFRGGTGEAERLLSGFLAERLTRYDEESADPVLTCASCMSPYLHFGQISPLAVALRLADMPRPRKEGKDAYLEQLLVRRELSMNFVRYNPNYDSYEALPEWARRTLEDHAGDPREPRYSLDVLEGARTHDPYWNAAMKEMLLTGKMHNTMRMYWGKKILQWSPDPREAFRRSLYLNNKYFLDGRDPNSFAGVAWIFGKHDRPWAERDIFGKVRIMKSSGLERKYDMGAYVRRIEMMQPTQRPRKAIRKGPGSWFEKLLK